MLKKVSQFLLCVVVVALGILVAGILEGVPVYFLWNWLMPELFGITEITFLQSIGLSILCHCLFKTQVNTKKE